TRCNAYLSALALLTGPLVQQAGAQQAPAPDRLSAGLGAQAPDFDRSVFEVGFKRSPRPDAYGFIVNLRFGRYSEVDVFGSALAQADGFTSGARPLYAAIFYGLQGPIPMVRVRGAYARASVGLTTYLGQTGTPGTETLLPVGERADGLKGEARRKIRNEQDPPMSWTPEGHSLVRSRAFSRFRPSRLLPRYDLSGHSYSDRYSSWFR
ncbi:MAG: hypothetical protein ACREM9_11165, partial [Gemmatimonadales bacterium]